jgi:peptidoglycan/LPS O-acetylase OafA/YrhL
MIAYRSDIDGLRAISIALVLAFHLGHLPGGFVGVDVFYVISGYLITGLVQGAIEKDQFTLGHRLIMAQPELGGSQLEHGEEV